MDLRRINFGIEIETVKRTRERVAQAIQSVVGGQVRHIGSPGSFDPWEVTDDHGRVWKRYPTVRSSSVPVHLRAEVVSPSCPTRGHPHPPRPRPGGAACGAKVDDRCGIHVHVDATAFDGRTLANLAKIVYKQEALILTALGVNETRRRNYSKPVSDDLIAQIERRRPRTRDQLNHIWYGYHNRQPQHTTAPSRGEFAQRLVPGHGRVPLVRGNAPRGQGESLRPTGPGCGAKALNGRAASSCSGPSTRRAPGYDFRVFLLHLGLIGDEFDSAQASDRHPPGTRIQTRQGETK